MPNLMLHQGSQKSDLKRLRAVKTPASTASYTAIPFADLRDMVVDAADCRGLKISDERWGLSRGDMRAFGVLSFRDVTEPLGRVLRVRKSTETAMTIGLRASHDQSLPVGLCAGGRVFVCDNLCFHADGLVEARRHTRHLMRDLDDMVDRVFEVLEEEHRTLKTYANYWNGIVCDDDLGLEVLGVMYGRQVISNRQFTVAVKHWMEPPDAFLDRTAWSLYNSVTEGLKHGESGTLLSRHMGAEEHMRRRFHL